MKNIIFNVTLLLVLGALSSCDREDPMANEQYIKQVYMVGAYQGVFSFSIPYSPEPQNAYVAVAAGGTLNIERDVTVTLARSDDAIQAYNDKYMIDQPTKYQLLPEPFYNIPSMSGTIKAGDIYARIPFSVQTEDLHCDSLYALAFKIASVSDYEQNPLTPTLILNLKLENDYSGVYQLQAVRYKATLTDPQNPETATLIEPNTISVSRTLKAVNRHTVRLLHEARAELSSGYKTNEEYWEALKNFGITFSLKPGTDNDFEIMGWMKYSTGDGTGGFTILAGDVEYAGGVFTFWYDYMDGNQRMRMKGTLTK